MDACESQTECKERGLGCRVCTTVEGFNGEVGGGAYVCVEEKRGDKTVDAATTTTTTTTTTATAATTTTAITGSPCSECSMTNVTSNFCGQLGIHTFMDACESQTECKERGLGCRVCTTVEGFDGDDVGGGAYVCVEEEGASKASDETTTTTTTTTALPTTTSSTSTSTTEALKGGIESLIGKKWKAVQIMWLVDSSSGELKEATEEDKNPITLLFKSDTRASGTCGNNHCSSGLTVRADQLEFGKFRRTRMAASEQETNYVYLLEKNKFFYEVSEDGNGSQELHLYEIIDEDDVKKRGRLMATYFQLSEGDEEEV